MRPGGLCTRTWVGDSRSGHRSTVPLLQRAWKIARPQLPAGSREHESVPQARGWDGSLSPPRFWEAGSSRAGLFAFSEGADAGLRRHARVPSARSTPAAGLVPFPLGTEHHDGSIRVPVPLALPTCPGPQ